MASQTTNLHLKKPALDDDALITDINNNMDLIDTYAGTTDTAITALQPHTLSNVDLNTVVTTGTYLLNGGLTNSPYGNYGYMIVSASVSGKVQYFTNANPGNTYIRTYYENAWTGWKKVEDGSNIGILATGSTAPKAISQGQYVVWGGALYTAKSAIASGATLSSSNLQSVSDGGLNALNSKIVPESVALTAGTSVTLTASSGYKLGNIVVFNAFIQLTSNIASDSTILTFTNVTAKSRTDFSVATEGGVKFLNIAQNTNALKLNGSTMPSGAAFVFAGTFVCN